MPPLSNLPRVAPSGSPNGQTSAATNSASIVAPIHYKDPQGRFSITIPGDWVINGAVATSTYTTIKFSGTNGSVSITFGSGKDPIGGCSESSKVILSDRTIDGCLLLQKDGSQILTRGYTKNSAGLDVTVEAYISPQLSLNKPLILDVIKTIAIF